MDKDKNKDNYKKHFEILELSEDASLADVKRSHEKLKKLYSTVSIATHPLDGEFGEEEKQEILNQIEEAYQILLRYMVEKDRVKRETVKTPVKKNDKLEDTIVELDIPEGDMIEANDIDVNNVETTDVVKEEKKEPEPVEPGVEPAKPIKPVEAVEPGEPVESMEPIKPVEAVEPVELVETAKPVEPEEPAEPAEPAEPDDTVKLVKPVVAPAPPKDLLNGAAVKGRTLKKIREKLGIGVHEIAVKTKISYKILVNIELERYEKLPESGYLRWHVMSYAKALSLDPKKIADDYMKRYRHWKSKQEDSGQ